MDQQNMYQTKLAKNNVIKKKQLGQINLAIKKGKTLRKKGSPLIGHSLDDKMNFVMHFDSHFMCGNENCQINKQE